MFVGSEHILTNVESADFEKEIIEGENSMKTVITAIANPIINNELKKRKNIEVIGNDIQYKDGVIEILEKEY